MLMSIDQLPDQFVFRLQRIAAHSAVINERKERGSFVQAAVPDQQSKPALRDQIEKRGSRHQLAAAKGNRVHIAKVLTCRVDDESVGHIDRDASEKRPI